MIEVKLLSIMASNAAQIAKSEREMQALLNEGWEIQHVASWVFAGLEGLVIFLRTTEVERTDGG